MLRAFAAGAKGFLVKESDPEVLRQALRMVAAGNTFVDPQVAGKLVAVATKGRRARGPYGLTLQEMRVLELLPKGLSNREIGTELSVSVETVKTHVRNAMRKLQVGDRAEAAAIAIREGLA
jgi:DNA-binding NarL/FixJ family response regulator